MNKKILILLIAIIEITKTQDLFQVSLSYPLALTHNNETINHMTNNFEGKIYVAFDAMYIRVYSEDFASYSSFNVS